MASTFDLDRSVPEAAEQPADERTAAAPAPPPRPPRDLLRTVSRGIGQTLITVGLVALLVVVYQLWVTSLLTSRQQDHLVQQIQTQWQQQSPGTPAGGTPATGEAAPPSAPAAAPPVLPTITVGVGQPFAMLHIPRLGGNWAVVEGVSQKQLAQGPGHYIGTAMPGEQGNFSVAGHAISSVFLHLDRLRPGDPIVVETAGYWLVYRVLGDPASGSFLGDPSGIPGQETVLPTGIQVIAPTPDGPLNDRPSGAYLTLTTCTPATTATHRLIVHARLDGQPISKAGNPSGPPALNG